MQFNKINNIVGWAVCLIACTVYIMTAEAGGSFWDCGEFVSSCFKLQIPHPPGAPLFVLLGRVFIIVFGDNPLTAARAVNIMSALASGFTILFLFWTITHFARRIAGVKVVDVLSNAQIWTIMGAGVVGALAYTFSDSFWYSAVEGEVYALSSFFTAIVFWSILKWEAHADEPGEDKWIPDGIVDRGSLAEFAYRTGDCDGILFPSSPKLRIRNPAQMVLSFNDYRWSNWYDRWFGNGLLRCL